MHDNFDNLKIAITKEFSKDLKNILDSFVIKDYVAYITLKADDANEVEGLKPLKEECEKVLRRNSNLKDFHISFVNTEKKFKNVIAITSCKGGVGKSTISANVANMLGNMGFKVGLLDTDIYGPSIPKLYNIKSKPSVDHNKKIIPIKFNNIEIMSIGFMISEDRPIIWRGPMIQSALLQLINDVKWSNLDFLVLDMPPGTGDVHLTIAQKLKIDQAIVVTTSEAIAIADTKKGMNMLLKFDIPISGIIENMSYFVCNNCSTKHFIYGENKTEELAGKFNTTVLGKLPFNYTFSNPISNTGLKDNDYKKIINNIVIKILD